MYIQGRLKPLPTLGFRRVVFINKKCVKKLTNVIDMNKVITRSMIEFHRLRIDTYKCNLKVLDNFSDYYLGNEINVEKEIIRRSLIEYRSLNRRLIIRNIFNLNVVVISANQKR